jgi:hypothetical protein
MSPRGAWGFGMLSAAHGVGTFVAALGVAARPIPRIGL